MDFGDPLGVPPPKGEKQRQGHIWTIKQNFTPIGGTVAKIEKQNLNLFIINNNNNNNNNIWQNAY